MQWQTTLPSLVRTLITVDPAITFIVPSVDAMVPSVKPAIIAVGAGDTMKIVSNNAQLPDMQAIATKKDQKVADVGASNGTHGLGHSRSDRPAFDRTPASDGRSAAPSIHGREYRPGQSQGTRVHMVRPFRLQVLLPQALEPLIGMRRPDTPSSDFVISLAVLLDKTSVFLGVRQSTRNRPSKRALNVKEKMHNAAPNRLADIRRRHRFPTTYQIALDRSFFTGRLIEADIGTFSSAGARSSQ